MGCGCGNKRRAFGGVTSAQTGRPLTPQEAAQNAIVNAGGGLAEEAAPKSGDNDHQ